MRPGNKTTQEVLALMAEKGWKQYADTEYYFKTWKRFGAYTRIKVPLHAVVMYWQGPDEFLRQAEISAGIELDFQMKHMGGRS